MNPPPFRRWLFSGSGSSRPKEFTPLGSILLFAATDEVVNRELWSIGDVNPEPPTPEEQTEDLIDAVETLVEEGELGSGQGRVLTGILGVAARSLDRGRTGTTIVLLRVFVRQVNRLIRRGRLPLADGQPLIDAANALISELSG